MRPLTALPAILLGALFFVACGGASGTDFGSRDDAGAPNDTGGGTSQGGNHAGGSTATGGAGGTSSGGTSNGGASGTSGTSNGGGTSGTSNGGGTSGTSNGGASGTSSGTGGTPSGGDSGTGGDPGTGGDSSTGGTANTGGTGGTAGTTPTGGTGGTQDCNAIVVQAQAALLAAQVCNPATDGPKCTGSVQDLCGCTVPVDMQSSEATMRYLAIREAAIRCGVPCLAIPCMEPTNKTACTPGGLMTDIVIAQSRCVYQR